MGSGGTCHACKRYHCVCDIPDAEETEAQLPTTIQWHSREVAMTWPEGSVVIRRYQYSGGFAYLPPERLTPKTKGFTNEFALLELPKDKV